MKFLILTSILALTVTLSLAIVVALYRHKKASRGPIMVIGQTGEVTSDLAPEGTVLVHGELWRARSRDGCTLREKTAIRVVGIEGHLMAVEPCEPIVAHEVLKGIPARTETQCKG